MNALLSLRSAWRIADRSALACRFGRCPFCGPALLLKLSDDETGIRCARCGASAVHLSIGWTLNAYHASGNLGDAYELSSRGPLVMHLRRRCRHLTLSELFDDVPRGGARDGVRCEDVQSLNFVDNSFDLITHTEVLEHVADDAAGLRELFRVLRPGGAMHFTVPMSIGACTRERAQWVNGEIVHLLAPTYHGDRLRGDNAVLCFRDYGEDVLDRVRSAGFEQVVLGEPDPRVPWSFGRAVISARKPCA